VTVWFVLANGLSRVFAFLGLLFSTFIAPAFSTVPPGFVDELVATLNAHDIPTGIALTPDSRVLITVQTGQLRVVANGALLPAPALNLTGAICTDDERGLQSVAVDPGFALNAHIFVFYTAPKAGDRARARWPPTASCATRLSTISRKTRRQRPRRADRTSRLKWVR
jgi:glucose/arabinose dehydrogenase